MNSKPVLWIILKMLSNHTYLFLLLQFLFIYNSVLQAQWVQTNGPYGGNVNCLAVTVSNIYAGTDAGVYLSTDNGTNWTQAGLPSYNILSIAANNNNVFAGISGAVFLSSIQ